jgi:hypothetical protein
MMMFKKQLCILWLLAICCYGVLYSLFCYYLFDCLFVIVDVYYINSGYLYFYECYYYNIKSYIYINIQNYYKHYTNINHLFQ